ncbi:hypothetical protein N9L06_00995 [Mariniblastus sp.]|nr:hypothetical protein [Mariniblastus sp.]
MSKHVWFYDENSFWGPVTKGPLPEQRLIELIAESIVVEKTHVLSQTRTKGEWRFAGDLPPLRKVIDKAARREQKAREVALQLEEERRAEEAARSRELKNQERAERQQQREAQQRRDNPHLQLLEEVESMVDQVGVIVRSGSSKKEKLYKIRSIEKEAGQLKRDTNHLMKGIRDQARTNGASAAAVANLIGAAVGKRGQGRSFGATSRRYFDSAKEQELEPLNHVKRCLDELLVFTSKAKYLIDDLPDEAFQQEVPESFDDLIESDDSYQSALVHDFEDLAFDVFCCLIACDGVITSDERKAVATKMRKIGSRRNEAELLEDIEAFYQRVKLKGFKSFEESVLSRVTKFSEMGSPLKIILEEVAVVAMADGKIADEEREFCKAVKNAISSPIVKFGRR